MTVAFLACFAHEWCCQARTDRTRSAYLHFGTTRAGISSARHGWLWKTKFDTAHNEMSFHYQPVATLHKFSGTLLKSVLT
jgi:hypothetical protein